jgi:hypothetical protein
MSFVNTVAAFNAAVALNPHIITCSWGSDVRTNSLSAADQALAAAVAAAVAAGIIVVFSAGNGQFGFPGQHPDVISAGGTFMQPDGSITASNYASGFMSPVYPGRSVPDLCGLVGMLPKAAYIMLPMEPGDQIDVQLAGGVHPNGDETPNNDGWAAISGTSAAAPQLAGVAALIKQACPKLTPADVKDILKKTARDVTTGACQQGFPAGPGPDQATGTGLVDAAKAVNVARLRCISIGPIVPLPIQPLPQPIQPLPQPIQPLPQPITPLPIHPLPQPISPIESPASEQSINWPIGPITPLPIRPIRPILPIRPIRPILPQPIEPILPVEPAPPVKPPIHPVQPVRPIEPVKPIQPVRPIRPILPIRPEPILPIQPIRPRPIDPGPLDAPGQESGGGRQITREEADAIEQMIVESDPDIE